MMLWNPRSTRKMLTMSIFLFQLVISLAVVNADSSDDNSARNNTMNGLFSSGAEITVAPAIVAVLAIVGGFIVCMAGYKLFRPVLFLSGFAVGSVGCYLLADKIFEGKSYVLTASWIAFLVGGIIVGCMILCFFRLGVFLVGAAAGILLAFTINTSFGYKMWPSNPNGMLAILIVALGLICGFLILKLEKPMVIIATSFFGAVACIWGVGYFAGKYPSGADLTYFRDTATGEYNIPGAWWAYLAVTLVLFAIGMYVQFHKTGHGVNHDMKSSKALGTRYHGTATPRGAHDVV